MTVIKRNPLASTLSHAGLRSFRAGRRAVKPKERIERQYQAWLTAQERRQAAEENR